MLNGCCRDGGGLKAPFWVQSCQVKVGGASRRSSLFFVIKKKDHPTWIFNTSLISSMRDTSLSVRMKDVGVVAPVVSSEPEEEPTLAPTHLIRFMLTRVLKCFQLHQLNNIYSFFFCLCRQTWWYFLKGVRNFLKETERCRDDLITGAESSP